jgi:hypothetical protein
VPAIKTRNKRRYQINFLRHQTVTSKEHQTNLRPEVLCLLNVNYDHEVWFCELQICVPNFLVPVLHAAIADVKFELTGTYGKDVRRFDSHSQPMKNSLLHYRTLFVAKLNLLVRGMFQPV